MKLYNTLNHRKEKFKPIKKGQVGLYSCGPTVYNSAHIGNLRSYIFSDILRRVLEYNGFKVHQVINITDVGHLTDDADSGEDKVEREAKRQKKTAYELVHEYEKAFKEEIKALNIEIPYKMPRATEHIKEQISLIKKLEAKGYTYKISDGIYFDTSALKDYGKLSGQKLKEKKGGARVKLSAEKKNSTDFALWKFSSKNSKRQMEWKSPWGVGFPGWHIECSAMSVKYLGQPFDIHTGGIDHIAVHHSNEIAQSEAAYGKPLANYWLHNEFVVLGKERLAKSKGNFITLEELEKRGYHPLAFRYLSLQTHYSKQLNFTEKALEAAQHALNKLNNEAKKLSIQSKELKSGCAKFEKQFLIAINDDLNIPRALAVVWDMLKSKSSPRSKLHTLFKFDEVLGLSLRNYIKRKIILPNEVEKLKKKRDKARKEKNWKLSDKIRNKLEFMGYGVEDTPKGTKIIIKN